MIFRRLTIGKRESNHRIADGLDPSHLPNSPVMDRIAALFRPHSLENGKTL
jgi:hypothetical protein